MAAPSPCRLRNRPKMEGEPSVATSHSQINRRAYFNFLLLLLHAFSLTSTLGATAFSATRSLRRRARFGHGLRFPQGHNRRGGNRRSSSRLQMIRNVDLPEAVIFYGTSSLLDAESGTTGPGVVRIVSECEEVGTPAVFLSEHRSLDEMRDMIASAPDGAALKKFVDKGVLTLKSSLPSDYPCIFGPDHPYAENPPEDFYGANSHAPSPGFLLDSVATTWLTPKGFGGSAGFGVKQEGVDVRPPLPKHCVVVVSGPDSRPSDTSPDTFLEDLSQRLGGIVITSRTMSQARCTAGRLAGMRVVYLEPEGMGTTDSEDLADAIILGFGDENDWEVVSLDDIATPGSFWLNPPLSRDDDGNGVSIDALCAAFQELRERAPQGGQEPRGKKGEPAQLAMDEDELQRILGDLDPL